MYCPNCGAQNEHNLSFCHNCGYRLSTKRKRSGWSIAAGIWFVPLTLFFLWLFIASSDPATFVFGIYYEPSASYLFFLSGLVGSIAGIMSVLTFLLPIKSFRHSWIGTIVASVLIGVLLVPGVYGQQYQTDYYSKVLTVLIAVVALTIFLARKAHLEERQPAAGLEFCPRCGNGVPYEAKFCGKCGRSLPLKAQIRGMRETPPEPRPQMEPAVLTRQPSPEAPPVPAKAPALVEELQAQQTMPQVNCPKCGAHLPAIAKFCTRCGQPLPRPSELVVETPAKPSSQVEPPPAPPTVVEPVLPRVEPVLPGAAQPTAAASPSAAISPPHVEPPAAPPRFVESVSPGVQPALASSAQRMQGVLPPVEQPRAQVLIAAPDLRVLAGQTGFLLTGLGTLIVLIAFFMSWFHVSSPLANMFLGGLATLDMSGMTILTGYPDLGLPGSPIVALIPLLALGVLAISVLRSRKQVPFTRGVSILETVLAVLGIAFMLVLFWLNRTAMDEIFRRFSIPGIVGQKIYSVEPAIGFWLTLVGFILIIGSAIWTWQRNR